MKIGTTLLPFLLLLADVGAAQSDTTSPTTLMLNEVVIQERSERPAVNKNSLPDLQTSTDEILSRIKGISLIRRGGYGQEITIRGLNAGQISVMLDGMAIFGACTDRMDPVSSYIEPNNLKSVEVGYGSGGSGVTSHSGGTVNFETQKPTLGLEDRWQGMAGIGVETNSNAFQFLTSVAYSGDRLAVRLNGIFRRAGNYHAGGGREIAYSQFQKWNGGLSARYKLNGQHQLDLGYIQDDAWNVGYPALLMDVAYARAKIASAAHVFYGKGASAIRKWETKIYYNAINHAMDDSYRPREEVPIPMDMPGTSRTFGFFSDLLLRSTKHELNVRVGGYVNRLHAEMTMYPDEAPRMFMLTIPDVQRNLLELAVSDRVKLNDRLDALWGIKGSVYNNRIFSPEGLRITEGVFPNHSFAGQPLFDAFAGLEQRLSNQWMTHVRVARSMRAPTIREQYGLYLFDRKDGYDYVGNPELIPPIFWNTTVGAHLKSSRLRIHGELFLYYIEHYIAGRVKPGFAPMTVGAEGVKQYENLDFAMLSGGELEITVPISRSVIARQVVTYTNGIDDEGRALPLIPPLQFSTDLRYERKLFYGQVMMTAAASQNHVNRSFYGEMPSNGFMVFDARAGREVHLGSVEADMNIEIRNILDADYYEHLSLLKWPSPGRNLVVHLNVYF